MVECYAAIKISEEEPCASSRMCAPVLYYLMVKAFAKQHVGNDFSFRKNYNY